MPPDDFRVLAINPGSTSTKFALFTNEHPDRSWSFRHTDAEMAPFANVPVLEQASFRLDLILGALEKDGIGPRRLSAVVGRGGKLHPLMSGTYRVNDAMVRELTLAPRGEHASNLGAILADTIARMADVDAFIVDPISVNERSALARLSGSALIDRAGFCHALNSKAVAKRFAREQDRRYDALRLIVAHLGGGVCISAHANGLMVDVTDAQEEGPFSPERSGTVPICQLIQLCFSGRYSQREVERLFVGEGGIYSYLGTTDFREVERRMEAGDARAALVFQGMAYQVAKEIGAMAGVLKGKVDAVLLTGGIAHSPRFTDALKAAVDWIAPVALYPGEEELQALAEGALRVLRGEEAARTFEAEAGCTPAES
jgi:butyrate kinase